MQSLATFFEDNKSLAYAAVVAAIIVLIFVVLLLYRPALRSPVACRDERSRTRQPRLGIVDAYDLDRQRQLVLVRRDNVEHLIMIGGPTDVVVESSIVRTQSAASPRDKDNGVAMVGGFAPTPALAAASAPPALAPAQAAALPPAGSRTEPSLAVRNEPVLASREESGSAGRAEPALGIATPMPSPIVDRAASDRNALRPMAAPDPSAPATVSVAVPAGAASEPPTQTSRALPPRPPSLPPRPIAAPPSAAPGLSPPPERLRRPLRRRRQDRGGPGRPDPLPHLPRAARGPRRGPQALRRAARGGPAIGPAPTSTRPGRPAPTTSTSPPCCPRSSATCPDRPATVEATRRRAGS